MIGGRVTVIGGPAAQSRAWPKLVKGGLLAAIAFWHRRLFAAHFKAGAAEKYGYSKRSEIYEKRKLRQKHHQQPLVWSGRLARAAQQRIDLTGTSRMARGSLTVPPHAYYISRSKTGTAIDKVAEMTAVSPDEATALTAIVDQAVERGLNAVSDTEVVE